MPGFDYQALTPDGRVKSGVLDAPTAAGARASLRAQGLLPVSLVPRAERAGQGGPTGRPTREGSPDPTGGSRVRPARGALSHADLALAFRQLSSLLSAGLRIEEALATVATGQSSRVAALSLALRARVTTGQSFADACDGFPQHFGSYILAAVRAGDKAGRLDVVLSQLAAHLAARAQSLQTIQLALIYPALLALVSLSMVIFLMTFVVPDIARVFASRGADLPVLTQVLLGISDGLRAWGLPALLGLAGSVLFLGRWLATPARRRGLDHALLATRGTGALVRQFGAARFTTTLATLLDSQVPLVDALQASVSATGNLALRARLNEVVEKVRQGVSLHRAMVEAQVFPPMVLAMVASGEGSGQLARAVGHAAQDQNRRIEAQVKTAVALFEPGILLVMGGLVTVIVLAILLPIVSLNNLVAG